eukprot:605515-Alexandrium_andersonii.AAC.1
MGLLDALLEGLLGELAVCESLPLNSPLNRVLDIESSAALPPGVGEGEAAAAVAGRLNGVTGAGWCWWGICIGTPAC